MTHFSKFPTTRGSNLSMAQEALIIPEKSLNFQTLATRQRAEGRSSQAPTAPTTSATSAWFPNKAPSESLQARVHHRHAHGRAPLVKPWHRRCPGTRDRRWGQLCTALCHHSPPAHDGGNNSCSPKAWSDPRLCLITSEELRAAENWNSIHPCHGPVLSKLLVLGPKTGFLMHFSPLAS